MQNVKISTRLLVLVGALCALLVAVGAIGLFGIAKSNSALESMYRERLSAQTAVADFRYLTARNRQLVSNALLSPAPEKVARALEEAEANIARSDKLWEQLQAAPMAPERQRHMQRISPHNARAQRELANKLGADRH